MDVPPFINSFTSPPLTMKPLASSRWPLMDWLPAFKPPEGAMATVTPAMTMESGSWVVVGHDPGLKRQQIRKTPAVERHRGHLRTAHYLAHLRAGGLHLDHVSGDGHFLDF